MAIKFLSTVAVDTNVLYVDAAANKVGIGTTSPSQKLHVDGSARVTGAYYDSGNAPGTANQLLASTATGTAWIDPSTIVAEAATLVVITCKNTSGATIAQGTPVYQTGTVGATATIEIAPADALISANKLPAIGLLQTALNNNGFGNVVITGELTNFTTDPIDGLTPTVGDKIFVKSGGGLTLTKPTGEGNGIQNMGLVGKVSGGNAGSITVSSIMRTNDVPNLPEGRIWVGDGNTIVSDTVYVDEPNNRVGIGTTSPNESLHIEASDPRIKIVDTDGTNWESEVFTQGGALKLQARNGTNFGNISFQGDNGTTQSEYARFNSVGNFGIGTTSPSERLAVNGNASISGGIYVGGVNSFIWNNTANSNLRFGANGSEKMRITSSGNVGIGTTNPNSILHITGANPEFILEDTTNLNRCRIKNNDGNLRFEADYNSQMGNSRHQFFIDGSEKLRINTDGNVGIGTTSPSAKLQVSSTSGWGVFTERGIKDGSTSTYSHNYSAGNAHILGRSTIFESSVTFSTSTATSTTKEYRLNNTSDKLTLASVVGGVTTDNNILVASGANVGIGTASPRAKLDVAGGVKVADDTDTATADKEGTLRYRLAPDVPKSQSMVDMCMKTGPSSYAWVNIVTNTWSN